MIIFIIINNFINISLSHLNLTMVDTVFCLLSIYVPNSENSKNIKFSPWSRENI